MHVSQQYVCHSCWLLQRPRLTACSAGSCVDAHALANRCSVISWHAAQVDINSAVSVELEIGKPQISNLQVEAKCEREAAVAAKKAARDAERAAAKALSVEERRFAKEAARCAKLGLPPPSPMSKCAQASWHTVPTLGTQSDRSSHRLLNSFVQLPNQMLRSFCSGMKLACCKACPRCPGLAVGATLSPPCCKRAQAV